MSSLMPSTSTLLLPSLAGEGGGDSCDIGFDFSLIAGGLISRDFFDGRSLSSPSAIVLGGDG